MVFLTETISIKSHLKKLDKVIASIISALLVIAVLDPHQLTESIIFIGEALGRIFIFLLASVLRHHSWTLPCSCLWHLSSGRNSR